MKQGLKTIQRSKARNFHYIESQKRLEETVLPFNSQVNNALEVDAVEIYYYASVNVGVPCSCEKGDNVKIDENSLEESFTIGKPETTSFAEDANFEIISAAEISSMFGENGHFLDSSDEFESNDDKDDFEPVDNTSSYHEIFNGSESLFSGHTIDCGVCGRRGFLPGYSLHNGIRIVFTHHDIVDAIGYTITKNVFPYRIDQLSPDGYIRFALKIPKYYKEAKFSIRNNTSISKDYLYFNGAFLKDSDLKANAGNTILISVKSKVFTHVCIEFYFDSDIIKANIPNINKTLDYTMLETVGNLQVVLPPTLNTVVAGDIIAIPKRNLVLKAVDIEHFQTNKMRRLEWRANCRVLQPMENLSKIHFNYRIF